MATPLLHPLDAKFVKLALGQQVLTPLQVKQGEEALARRAAAGAHLTLEQVLVEEGYLTEAQCQALWEALTRAGDTQAREQIAARREHAAPESAPRPAAASDATHAEPAPRPFGQPSPGAPRRIAGYELLEWIGGGGMGAVYRARQVAMERDVALKILPPELASNARFIRRFIREARAAGQLDHGNLVGVYDVGEEDGRYFISMEYVAGRTVKQILKAEGRLTVAESLRIIAQVAAALECAHRHKIVHRDIKPDNIMLTARGLAKLCDLGLAKALEGPLHDTDTQDGLALGTPHYMSPEQARGEPVDARSDLFSLGATLYHMVTGRPPFEGRTPVEVLMKVISEDPPAPDRLEPLLPAPLTRLLRRLLAKDPRRRPASAARVRAEVELLLADLESGRVFAFREAPSAAWDAPTTAVRKAPPQWRRWLAALAGAAAFLVVCAAMRFGLTGNAPPPPPPPPFFFAASAPGTNAKGEPNAPPGAATAHPAPKDTGVPGGLPAVARPGPVPPSAGLDEWESQLAAHPESWPQVLVAVEQALAAGGATDAQHERLAALQEKAGQVRDAAAKEDRTRRRAIAAGLAKSGFLRQALAVCDDAPELLRQTAAADTQVSAAQLEKLAQAGMHLVVRQRLEAWERELAEDEAPPEDLRWTALLNAAQRARQAAGAAAAELAAGEARRQALNKTLEAVRKLSRAHDLSGAMTLCEETLAKAASDAEKRLFAAEKERLTRAQALFATVAAAIAKHPGAINEKDFRPKERPTGDVMALSDRFLVVSVRRGAAENRANLPLASISRDEMRALFDQVFRVRRYVPEDRLGRLAYDLEDAGGASARARLPELADRDELAAAWLEKVLAAEAVDAPGQARTLLVRAEELYVRGACLDCTRTVAAALEALGTRPDAALEARAQALLRLAYAALEAGALLGGDCAWLPHGRARLELPAVSLTEPPAPKLASPAWTWANGAPTVTLQNALNFGAVPLEGRPAWTFAGPGRFELDVLLPERESGELTLSLTPADAPGAGAAAQPPGAAAMAQAPGAGAAAQTPGTGVTAQTPVCGVTLQASDGKGWLSFISGATPEPAWTRSPFDAGRQERLWLRVQPGWVSWGLGDRALGSRRTALAGRYQVSLQGVGNCNLYGLRVEGQLTPERRRADWEEEGAAAYARVTQGATGAPPVGLLAAGGTPAAPQSAPGAREEALRAALSAFEAHAGLASRCCAALAVENRAAGREAAARYWASRALFAYPAAERPPESAALLEEHRRAQARTERIGQPPLDPRLAPETVGP